MKRLITVFLTAISFTHLLVGCDNQYESMYDRTPAGKIEIKTLPSRVSLQATSDKGYFENDNGLFMNLFRYIQKNEVAMTVPVEAEMKPGSMRFFAGSSVDAKSLKDAGNVKVKPIQSATVVSIGIRGSYSQSNFQKGQAALDEWLKNHPEWKTAGDSYGVYWNGPYVPGPMKRSEVHIPVVKQTE
jgi:hypothetical protein